MAYWWVNQGESYRQEEEAGILWAPLASKDGRRLVHWDAMTKLVIGDMVWHYSNGRVVALSRVTAEALDARRPADLSADLWTDQGRQARAAYRSATSVVRRDDIPIEWRADEPQPGPFQRNLLVKTGYLFPLSETFAARFLERFGHLYPLDQPATTSDSYAEDLLRSLVGIPLETLNQQPNLILEVDSRVVLVGTNRSMDGRPVPVADVQRAYDRLMQDRQLLINPTEVGYRSAFIGAVLRTLPGVAVGVGPPARLVLESTDAVDKHVFEGPLSTPQTTYERREQGLLRRTLFGIAADGRCALCGRRYPVQFLRAAHIKPRSVCSEEERRDLSHVAMAACVFGCDTLFELGYVGVRKDGWIVVSRRATTPAVAEKLEFLRGKVCSAHTQQSAKYFAWHFEERYG